MFKSGFVAIIGRPNVGKSTLLNQILGQKISIISSTSQTTRNAIKGIYTTDDAQIVFVDTPGIHKSKNSLGDFMNKQSFDSLKEVDCVIWLIDASEEYGSGDEYLKNLIKDYDLPLIIVFNKMDLITDNKKFEDNKNLFLNDLKYEKVEYISSINNQNIDLLLNDLKEILDEGPQYYDADQVTDVYERFIISEIIREKIFYLTKEEVPHSVAVEIEEIKELDDKVEVYACIVCEKESQKKILIGEKAAMIKNIKKFSKIDIKKLMQKPIYLEIFVKVDKDWRNNKTSLSRLGYKNSR